DYRYDNTNDDEHGQYWGKATIKMSYDFEVVKAEMKESASLVLGGQGNLWTERVDFGRDNEALLFPRLVALAESLWSENKDWEKFKKKRGAIEKRLSSQDVMFWSGEWN
ncbi:family 20 glycosylhydrolase, partial [Bullifex sp.]|uniref:family 20 glycosylhydrolase n=1 Tax=Bullifex sp. TaxID=2815808 RepID=UPI002A7FA49D